jgi:hypothetical protein
MDLDGRIFHANQPSAGEILNYVVSRKAIIFRDDSMMLSNVVVSPCLFVVDKIRGFDLISDFAKKVMPSAEAQPKLRPVSPNNRHKNVQFQQQFQ